MEPDRAALKGSLRHPPRLTPRMHGWNLQCRFEGEVDLDFAVASVLKRVEGLVQPISALSEQEAVKVSVHLAIADRKSNFPCFSKAAP